MLSLSSLGYVWLITHDFTRQCFEWIIATKLSQMQFIPTLPPIRVSFWQAEKYQWSEEQRLTSNG